MRYFISFMLIVLFFAVGCTSEVAKETAEETGKEIIEKVNDGVENASQTISDAAPYLQEDIKEGFWNALESLEILIEGESVKDVLTPAEMKAIQFHQGINTAINRGVTQSAQVIDEKKADVSDALNVLAETINKEINLSKEDGSTTSADKPMVKLPTPEEIQKSWETLSGVAKRPDTARAIFNNIDKHIKAHEEYNVTCDIVGPVPRSSIGKVANDFVTNMKPGDVSKVVKFKDGYLMVQMIELTEETVEVGYIYIPTK